MELGIVSLHVWETLAWIDLHAAKGQGMRWFSTLHLSPIIATVCRKYRPERYDWLVLHSFFFSHILCCLTIPNQTNQTNQITSFLKILQIKNIWESHFQNIDNIVLCPLVIASRIQICIITLLRAALSSPPPNRCHTPSLLAPSILLSTQLFHFRALQPNFFPFIRSMC